MNLLTSCKLWVTLETFNIEDTSRQIRAGSENDPEGPEN